MTIAIEQIELEELQAFLRAQAEDAFPDLKDEKRLAMLSEKWHSQAEICTCRNDKGQLVGMIAFYANQPENGIVYIPHVYVNSECRGKKLMSSMLDTIKEYANDKGFYYMRLEVKKTNQRAQRAYMHYGFGLSGDASNDSLFFQTNILKPLSNNHILFHPS